MSAGCSFSPAETSKPPHHAELGCDTLIYNMQYMKNIP